jgi:hypothetical protein
MITRRDYLLAARDCFFIFVSTTLREQYEQPNPGNYVLDGSSRDITSEGTNREGLLGSDDGFVVQ